MWKITITYDDKSKITLTGKHKDIPLNLAVKFFNLYAANHICKACYQQFPKKEHKEMDLMKKIEELQQE